MTKLNRIISFYQTMKSSLIKKVDRWEEYKSFFQLIILRYLIVWFSIVPIIAGLVEQLPNPLPLTISGQKILINLELPFHWQLLWLSSFFFVLALAVYKLFCPKFIHKYNNYSDYLGYNHHTRWLVWETSFLLSIANKKQKGKLKDRLLIKKYLEQIEDSATYNKLKNGEFIGPKVEGKQTKLKFKIENNIFELCLPLDDEKVVNEKNDYEKDIFYELFGRYSASRFIPRFIIKILLIISLVLFIIALLQHIHNGWVFTEKWLELHVLPWFKSVQ